MFFPVSDDKTMKIYDLVAGKVVLDIGIVGGSDVSRACMACDDSVVVANFGSKKLGAWDIKTGKLFLRKCIGYGYY